MHMKLFPWLFSLFRPARPSLRDILGAIATMPADNLPAIASALAARSTPVDLPHRHLVELLCERDFIGFVVWRESVEPGTNDERWCWRAHGMTRETLLAQLESATGQIITSVPSAMTRPQESVRRASDDWLDDDEES